jgi:hypothetical protein
LEVIMLTRRIATTVCALCLAVPAVAGASEGTNPPNGNSAEGTPSTVKAKGPYGTAPTGPRSTVKVRGPYGNRAAGPRSTVKASGPYGNPAAGPRTSLTASGPYGIAAGTTPYGIATGTTPSPGSRPQNTTAAPIHGSGTSPRHDTNPRTDTNGWRAAAISEAALLAAVLLGWALLLTARRRAAHMVT